MKKIVQINLIVFLFLSFFSTNKTFAQCQPVAGVDTAICGLDFSLEGTLTNVGASAEWSIFSVPVIAASAIFTNSSQEITNVSVTHYGVYEFVLRETFNSCIDYDTILIEFIYVLIIVRLC